MVGSPSSPISSSKTEDEPRPGGHQLFAGRAVLAVLAVAIGLYLARAPDLTGFGCSGSGRWRYCSWPSAECARNGQS